MIKGTVKMIKVLCRRCETIFEYQYRGEGAARQFCDRCSKRRKQEVNRDYYVRKVRRRA